MQLFVSLALAAALVPDRPPHPFHARTMTLIQQLQQQTSDSVARMKKELSGRVSEQASDWSWKPITDDQLLQVVRKKQARIQSEVERIEGWHRSYLAGHAASAEFRKACNFALKLCLAEAFAADISEAGWLVRYAEQRQGIESSRCYEEYNAIEDAVPFGAEREAILAKAKEGIAAKEEAAFEKWLRHYEETTKRFLERRRSLCGEAWRLVDHYERRNDTVRAKEYRDLVYKQFCYLLRRRPRAQLDRLGLGRSPNSAVDWFVTYPGSDDRFIARTNYIDDALLRPKDLLVYAGLYKMDNKLAQEPVESLRKYDSSTPRLNVNPDPPLEFFIRALEKRKWNFRQLELKQATKIRALEKANRGSTAKTQAELDALQRDLGEYGSKYALVQFHRENRERNKAAAESLDAQIAAALAKLRESRSRLANAEPNVRVSPKGSGYVEDASGPLASTVLSELDRRIAGLEASIKGLPEDDKARVRQGSIARLEAKKGVVAQIVVDARVRANTPGLRRAVEQRQREVDQLRASRRREASEVERHENQLAELPTLEADDVLEQLIGRYRALDGELERETSEALQAGIHARQKTLREQKFEQGLNLRELLGQTTRLDRALRDEAAAIARLKVGALALARTTIDKYSDQKLESDLETLLQEANTGLQKSREFLDKIGKVNNAELLEKLKLADLQERLGIVAETLGTIGGYAETLQKIVSARDKLTGDKATALQGLAEALAILAPLAENTPVIGPVVGKVLSGYAQATAAAASGVAALMEKQVGRELKALEVTIGVPATRGLYTVKSLGILNADEADKLVARLQVQRLLYLVQIPPGAGVIDQIRKTAPSYP